MNLIVCWEIQKDDLQRRRIENLLHPTLAQNTLVRARKGGLYLEDLSGTLSEEFSDDGTRVTKMRVIDLETFQVSFSEIIDSSTVHGFPDFIRVFK